MLAIRLGRCHTGRQHTAEDQFRERGRDLAVDLLREAGLLTVVPEGAFYVLADVSRSGLDSLAFAILVARLEDDLGIDPFTVAEDAAFPSTVGEFVRAYENVPA